MTTSGCWVWIATQSILFDCDFFFFERKDEFHKHFLNQCHTNNFKYFSFNLQNMEERWGDMYYIAPHFLQFIHLYACLYALLRYFFSVFFLCHIFL
jgi:hypothetical protein